MKMIILSNNQVWQQEIIFISWEWQDIFTSTSKVITLYLQKTSRDVKVAVVRLPFGAFRDVWVYCKTVFVQYILL